MPFTVTKTPKVRTTTTTTVKPTGNIFDEYVNPILLNCSHFIHFSIRYHIIHFQDNAVNDVYPWTLDDGFAPSKDKGAACSKICVT